MESVKTIHKEQVEEINSKVKQILDLFKGEPLWRVELFLTKAQSKVNRIKNNTIYEGQ